MLLEQAALALLDYIEESTDGFRILVRDSPVGPVDRHVRQRSSATSPARSSTSSADEFKARGFDAKFAPMYAQMLVGMVALTGQWWLDAPQAARSEASPRTWSTSPGTACPASSASRR